MYKENGHFGFEQFQVKMPIRQPNSQKKLGKPSKGY